MEKRILSIVFGLLIGVLGWIWSVQYGKLVEIERNLVEIKLDIVKIQATMIDRDEVIRIVKEQLKK